MWHVGDCGVCIVGKMAKDVGTAIRKSSYCGVVSTLLFKRKNWGGVMNNLLCVCIL